jgi:hypothetical protein
MIHYCNPTAAAAAVMILGLSLPPPATAQLGKPVHSEIPLETLKSAYLKCERMGLSGKLVTGDIMMCSVIYEEVKRRAFDGDFTRLKAWADGHLRPIAPEVTGN